MEALLAMRCMNHFFHVSPQQNALDLPPQPRVSLSLFTVSFYGEGELSSAVPAQKQDG